MAQSPYRSYAVTFAAAAAAMSGFEYAKEVFSQGTLDTWESHLITIAFGSFLAVLANVYMRRAISAAVLAERRGTEDELRRINDRLRLSDKILRVAEEGVIVLGTEGSVVATNAAFTQITGYREEEVVGHPPPLLYHEQEPPAFFETLWAALRRDRRWSGELVSRRKDGELFVVWANIVAVEEDDGRVGHYAVVFRNVTEARQRETRITHLAFHDVLTGLQNRLLLDERLEYALAIAKRKHQELLAMFIDLDGFKQINDIYGHQIGDTVLREIGQRIGAWARRDTDSVARVGGDEFVVLTENTIDDEFLAARAALLIERINAPISVGGTSVRVGASLGAARFPQDASNADELLHAADRAMYEAKKAGKNCLRLASAASAPNAGSSAVT